MKNTNQTQPTKNRRRTPADRADQIGWGSVDPHCEVATVLLSKRWEQHDEPFRGFDSPPGKF